MGESELGARDITGKLIFVTAMAMAAFHLLAASPLWLAPNLAVRAAHLLFAVLLLLLLMPSHSRRLRWVLDVPVLIMAVVGLGYVLLFHQQIAVRPPWTRAPTPLELTVAVFTIFAVLDVTRRSLGWLITGLCAVFIVYAFVGTELRHVSALRPLAHGGVNIAEFVDQMYFSYEGIFGTALGVSAEYIFLFVMFGAVLQTVGGGDFFIAITRAVTGTARGGPAKMAVIASGLMGMMSGSSVANVATTGSLTIPLMKRLGYPARLAGAIEAIASTGGQVTPPIMGAAAFLMAAIIGIDYLVVVGAAAVPALLFYCALMICVHMTALKYGLEPMEKAQKGETWQIMKAGWTFLLPVGLLVALMLRGYSPSYSAFFGVMGAMLIPYVRPSTFISPMKLAQGIRLGAEGAAVVAAACASAGIIVGVVQISGLGFKFSAIVTGFSGGSLDMALLLAMIASFIFGMGMPTTAAYIIQATLVAPALIRLGADPLAAHMFVFYYAVLGQITPPLAVAAYAAAPIAGETANRVGWTAFAIGLPIYIIPFMFVANGTLLAPEVSLEFAYVITRTIVALLCLSLFVVGWLAGGRLGWLLRLAMLGAAVLMIHPDVATTLAGLGILIAIWICQKYFLVRRHTRKMEALRDA